MGRFRIIDHREEIIKAIIRAYVCDGSIRGYWKYIDFVAPAIHCLSSLGIVKDAHERLLTQDIGITEMGRFDHSYNKGMIDSGILRRRSRYGYDLYRGGIYDEMKNRFPYIVRLKDGVDGEIRFGRGYFLRYLSLVSEFDERRYLGGLFASSRIASFRGKNWFAIDVVKSDNISRVREVLGKWNIAMEEVEGVIYVSPFYGALFWKEMGKGDGDRVRHIEDGGLCPEIGYLYWRMLYRGVGRKRLGSGELPYSLSYASYWNRGICPIRDWRREMVEMGIYGMSDRLRGVIDEWVCGV